MSVLRLVLDRPEKANALDVATVERLHTELDAVRDGDIVVVEARGRVFCAGLDLDGLDTETDASMLLRLVRVQLLLERLRSSPTLVVACVTGAAVGAGADLALAADVRLALPGASLRFPGSGFGAVLGTGRLAEETSPSYATEAAATGRRIDDLEASAQGLWRLLGTPDELAAEVSRLSARHLPPGTVPALRRAAAPGAAASDAGSSGAGDPLGHLVRSLASTPGLRDRIRQHRDQSFTRHKLTR